VLSGGRVGLGIGAAWNEEESKGLGLAFPPTAERFERLEEALRICLQMWSGSEEPFAGKHYQLGRTLNSPQVLTQPHPYLMIGGGGEKKTLRMVAQYADACNIGGGPEVAAHKLQVLRGHCETLGRDYGQIEKTAAMRIDPSSTVQDIVGESEALRELGFTANYVFASGIVERERIISMLGEAQSRLA
jgi:alkanesulfonate monooxygenase